VNGRAELTGTIDAYWEATSVAYYDLFRAGTMVPIIVTVASTTVDPGSTAFPTMVYTMTNAQLRGTSPTVGGPDLIDVSIPFVVKYDGTNAPLKVEVTETATPPGSEAVADPVRVEGLREFRRDLKRLEPEVAKELRKDIKAAAEKVALTRPRTHLADGRVRAEHQAVRDREGRERGVTAAAGGRGALGRDDPAPGRADQVRAAPGDR
jgi:hypothetical protein